YAASTPVTPMVCAACITGGYKILDAVLRAEGVFTHTTALDAYRGYGRAESCYVIERMINRLAQEIEMDPVALRRKNFIQPDEFPYATAMNNVYDNGHYEVSLARALELLDYDALRAQQRIARTEGHFLGIGISTHVWRGGFRSTKSMGIDNWVMGGWEKSTVTVSDNGGITVTTGTCSIGQGIVTATAQIVADVLSVDIASIHVIEKDTFAAPHGNGSMGSRSLIVGGSATLLAAKKVRQKLQRLAAHLLGVGEDELELREGRVVVSHQPERSVPLYEVARLSQRGEADQPPGTEPVIEETAVFELPEFAPEYATHTAAWGTHICVAEVEPDTGKIDIQRYVAVDDLGRVVNPKIVAGQIHGGVAQGLGQALMEEAVYDDDGQLLTSSFLDYCTPRAADMPWLEVAFTETPNPTVPLGARSVGEAGVCGASPALVNAVVDALSPLGITHIDMPLRPEKIWQAINEARHNAPVSTPYKTEAGQR
ncbi:MAG: molybdopterin-dependent oxidoreductase, partial [Halieaceae bacterium]|nr:molybdopterin-dependent oxidoreductase [Halieaceae bacterium]